MQVVVVLALDLIAFAAFGVAVWRLSQAFSQARGQGCVAASGMPALNTFGIGLASALTALLLLRL